MNCRKMEGGPFLDERLQKEFGRFVEIRLHNDHSDPKIGPRNKEIQREQFGTVTMPYYVLIDREGKVRWNQGGLYSADEFLEKLQSVP